MFTVEEVVNDPDLAQPFTILRSAGSWLNGAWSGTTLSIQGYGVISVAQARDIEMLPEGDRVSESMVFHSSTPIYGTGDGMTRGSSDILIWSGNQYRAMSVARYSDYGYYRVVAVRLKTD